MYKINLISTKHKNIHKDQGMTKYLYKNVFTKNGEKIGRIIQIIFDKKEIIGVIVGKGFFFKKMFIDIEYVDKFTKESIILNIQPVTLLKGKIVFDSEGRIVGKVKRVNRKTNANTFESLIIKKGLFSKEKIVHPKDVIILKKNIRLKVELEK